MSQIEALIQELEQEAASTRRFLERVPAGKGDYTPHPKSMTLARLAGHVAEMPEWGTVTLTQDELDMHPPGGEPMVGFSSASADELVATFDRHVAAMLAALRGSQDADLGKPWTLKSGSQVYFTMPKAAVLRSFVFSHLVHHRAQLGVYLRLNDIAVPSSYGPTADESGE
jgi:uncharacterized damage-inducible protein DinB